jgi:hypothetical protein
MWCITNSGEGAHRISRVIGVKKLIKHDPL